MPISRPAQPPSRKNARTPYAAATDSRFITAAVNAITRLRNATSNSRIDIDDDTTDQERQAVHEGLVQVDVRRGPAAHERGRAAALDGRERDHRLTHDDASGPRFPATWGPVLGITVIRPVSPVALIRAWRHRGDAIRVGEAGPQPLDHAVGLAPTGSQRPVVVRWSRVRTLPTSGRRPVCWTRPAGRCRRQGRDESCSEERRGHQGEHGDAPCRGQCAVPLHEPAPPHPADGGDEVTVRSDPYVAPPASTAA